METNKQILINAIQQLPSFVPDDQLWKQVQAELDQDHYVEKNKTALDKACLQLPEQQLEVNLWMRIEQSLTESSNEKQKTNLDQAIIELPEANFDDEGLWSKIEEDLESNNYEEINRNRLEEAISSLPIFDEELNDDTIWQSIERELKTSTKTEKQRVFSMRKWLAIAASLFICLLAAWGITQTSHQQTQQQTTETVAVNFSEEETETNTFETFTTDVQEYDEANDFIQSYCSSLPPECRSTEFTTLQEQLHEVEEEYEKLKRIYEQNKKNVEVFSYIIRLEKQKNALTKTLIQLIVT